LRSLREESLRKADDLTDGGMMPRMTPRERVLAALAHRQPDRVPFSYGFGPTGEMTQTLTAELARRGIDWPRLRLATDDVAQVDPRYIGPPLAAGVDIWGVRWQPMSYGGGTYNELDRLPLAGAGSPEQVRRHPWPRVEDFDYADLTRQLDAATAAQPRKAIRCTAGNPFEWYTWMTGMEEALSNLIDRPAVVLAAMECITDFWEARLARVQAAAGGRIDLLFFADDLGSQQGPLMSPAAYRRFIQPFHRRLFAAAARLAPESRRMFHSDGSAAAMIPDLLDAGIEVLEAVQVECADMEPESLKGLYGDRLSFHGAISVQQLLPHADPAAVAAQCRHLVDVLGRGGGYIAAPSHAIQYGTPVDNVLAMLQAVLGEDDYEQAMAQARTNA
jgi:uroporphyrinogen decarboxylase